LVQFTKLRLTGFKSFVDTTELAIAPGITGIVGPNGCGKSNLVEALRWAMGETSAKRMRGGEMDDVIFGGTGSRPARNIAEVTLCLDNSDRKVPAQFNDSEELEVVRRIDRGEGSSYRVNGKEARARDVQLLFADAATGAQSTALVSQGRIGAIINAKPTDRRGLLEEAAGITGLHSRRHEAELRLRAAEANLTRLDDVIVTLESQLAQLKKQARQASRYRNLNDHIRRAEAALFHLHWRDAEERRAQAVASLTAAETAVVALTSAAAIAATQQSEAASQLPALRQAEAEAAAELQRLTIERANLEREEERVAAAQADAARQLRDAEADTERETALATDAAEAQARLSAERETLADVSARESAIAEEATRAMTSAAADVEECEGELAQLTQNVAAGEARQAALARRLGELQERLARLRQRIAESEAEHDQLKAALAADTELAAARQALGTAEAAIEETQSLLTHAETTRQTAASEEAETRDKRQATEANLARLKAEADALRAIFADSASDMWPPMVDALTVAPGYETALGAALGDDLQASSDSSAPLHWRETGDGAIAAGVLPGGITPLSAFVTGSALLQRRLSQIGVAADEAACRALAPQLAQGQRLVTKDGAMWRWDGYTVTAGSPTAAAVRLKQKNRLNELTEELAAAEAHAMATSAAHAEAKAALDAALREEQAQRQNLQAAYNAARQAREAAARVEQRTGQTTARIATLESQAASLKGDIAEAEQQIAATETDRAALPDLKAAQDRIMELRPLLAERRTRLIECRSANDRLQREAAQRQQRLAAIAEELASWAARAEKAVTQLQALAERRTHIAAEIDRLAKLPAEITERRHRLLDLIETAEGARRQAADTLATAETALAGAERNLKAEEGRLVEARENRVRTEAAVAQAEEAAATLKERIQDRLDCTPEDVLRLAELEPGEPLPDRASVEARVQRLLRERETMGPVNLRAEVESSELDQQLSGMQSERSDLVNAIARLRQGINSLNREGRERLLAAFELVSGHFEQLFTRLFGGGRAHLRLTEAEDPLEAGLEILASPPGKKLQVMSLLSGGEQALTALALLFAVFMVNPAPICVLDEVDAPLDDANVERFCNLVDELARTTSTRFLVITHHRLTMARMDRLFGVTMAERGVSQLVSVDLQEIDELRAAS